MLKALSCEKMFKEFLKSAIDKRFCECYINPNKTDE